MAKKTKITKKETIEKIKELFKEAKKLFETDKKLANRRISQARRIAMKNKVRIPTELKRRFCKNCYSYLVPGKNLRVRTQKNRIIMYCLECKKFTRIGLKKRF